MLSVGIVGLPNVGKSTLFNALLKRQVALVASYPFTTIEPHTGVVAVPDERVAALAGLESLGKAKIIPATVKFIDIAGLVKNAHQGEGLGNQFLSHIRETDAIIHLLRGFESDAAPHYYGSLDPERDKEIVELELEMAEIKKPTLYVLNTDKRELNKKFKSLRVDLKNGEGVDKLIQEAYKLLDLITFYTIKGGQEIAARSLARGGTALDAAERVHTDMAKGFIKAEVIGWQELVKIGSWQNAKKSGRIRVEGRDYLVKDGEVVEIKFN